jgi:hypothetical protein
MLGEGTVTPEIEINPTSAQGNSNDTLIVQMLTKNGVHGLASSESETGRAVQLDCLPHEFIQRLVKAVPAYPLPEVTSQALEASLWEWTMKSGPMGLSRLHRLVSPVIPLQQGKSMGDSERCAPFPSITVMYISMDPLSNELN